MKLKIKVKELTEGCMPEIIEKGDLIDLRAADTYIFNAPQAGIQHQKDNKKYRDVTFDEQAIKLGVAMQLPKGMMAKLKGRSSLTKKHGVVMCCSGEIDNSYNGNGINIGHLGAGVYVVAIITNDNKVYYEKVLKVE